MPRSGQWRAALSRVWGAQYPTHFLQSIARFTPIVATSNMDQVKPKEEQELWEPAEVDNSDAHVTCYTHSQGVQVKAEPEDQLQELPQIRVIVKNEDDAEEEQYSIYPTQTEEQREDSEGADEEFHKETEADTDSSGDWPLQHNNDLRPAASEQTKQHKCLECGKVMQYSQNLKQHMLLHTGQRPFSCSVCEKTFLVKDNLKSHIRTHTGKKPYSCLICNKQYTQKCNLQKHMKKHSHKRQAESSEDNSDGAEWTEPLFKHLFVNNKERFVCAFCDKTFSHRGNFNSHLLVHSEERPFICSVCDKTFSRKSNLTSHMLVHSEDKPFSCSVCEKTFARQGDLKKHVLTHSQKSYSCLECGKTFNKQLLFNRHILIHSERQFNCKVCHKKFLREVNLDKHMLTHTGEKPYSCSDCDKTFYRQCHLSKHMSSHKSKRPVSSTRTLIHPKPVNYSQCNLVQVNVQPGPTTAHEHT